MTEELRDDHYQHLLNNAFELKNRLTKESNEAALSIYEDVLRQEFLNRSIIEKHQFMRYNALKNSAEIYERVGEFKMAKHHYTQALRIKEKDPFIWTRLGYLEYEIFQDLNLARQCFEAAAQTCSTFERRSSKINVILVKLAEIYFQQQDFKSSESLVDAILSRISPLAQPTPQTQEPLIFAYLLKSFFLSLNAQTSLSAQFLNKARSLKPTAQVMDIEVIRKMVQQSNQNLKDRITIVCLTENDEFVKMNDQGDMQIIEVQCSKKDLDGAPEVIDDFLLSLVQVLEKTLSSTGSYSFLETTKLNFDAHMSLLQQQLTILVQTPQLLKASPYFDSMFALDASLNNFTLQQDSNQVLPQTTNNQTQQPHQKASAQANTLDKHQRSLRRKPDSTEQQMKQYTVTPLRDILDQIVEREFPLSEGDFADLKFQEVMSHREIINAKNMFEKQGCIEESKNSENVQGSSNVKGVTRRNEIGQKEAVQMVQMYGIIIEGMHRLNGKGTLFAVRSLIRVFIEDEKLMKVAINFNLASHLYKLFIILTKGDLTKPILETCFGLDHTNDILLTLFEISLFNQQAIANQKSGALMFQREKFFDFFTNKELEIMHSLERDRGNTLNQKSISQKEIRFFYSMMYYSFEIKNNMHASINYFQKLQQSNSFGQESAFPVYMPWVSHFFTIDESKVSDYGGVKINKAQIVKTNDEELMQLKLSELRENEESKKQNIVRTPLSKVKPQFTKFSAFYLDQLCHYLAKMIGSSGASGQTAASQDGGNFEEKVKEMWGKLMYSVCRCPTPQLLQFANYLFSVLTAYQYVNKQVYEQFILKKLEFEPIITELQERLKIFHMNEVMEVLNSGRCSNLFEVQQSLLAQYERDLLGQEGAGIEQLIKILMKIQVHLLRLVTCEFLFYHVVQNIQKLQEGQQLLQAYFQVLFLLEFNLCILRATSMENQDLTEQLRPVLILIKRLDKLSLKNNDIFAKAYFKLHVLAFPPILSLVSTYLSNSSQGGSLQRQWLSEENDLLQLVMLASAYFMEVKFNSRDLNLEGEGSGEQDQEKEEDSSDEKKIYELKCLNRMKERGQKYWSTLLTNLLPQSILQQLTQPQGASASQQNQLPASAYQLAYIYQVTGSVDIYFLRDMCVLVDAIAVGNRYTGYGIMGIKDIANISTLIDTIAKYLLENYKYLSDSKNAGQVYPIKHMKFQEKSEAFKNSIEPKSNPLAFLSQLQKIKNAVQYDTDKNDVSTVIGQVTFFVMNVATHLALDNASQQQITLKTNPQRRKKLLEQQLNNLSSGGSRLLKNLRSISQLDLVYSNFQVENLLMQSQLTTEWFVQANNFKLMSDYKKQLTYTSFKQKYHQSLNVLLIAIQQLFLMLRDEQHSTKDTCIWQNINRVQKLKLSFSQALMIITWKMQANRYLVKRGQTLSSESEEKRSEKVRNLQLMIIVLSSICEKLEKFVVISEDPRLASGKKKDINQAVLSIVETFLAMIQTANQASLSDRVRFHLPSASIPEFEAKIGEITKDFRQRMDQIKMKTSFEYPYFQVLFQSKLQPRDSNSKLEEFTPEYLNMITQLNKSLEVAFLNGSIKGCLELFVRILRHAIRLNIVLRYLDEGSQSQSLVQQMKVVHEQVTKNLIGDKKAIFKLIMSQISPQASNTATNQQLQKNLSKEQNDPSGEVDFCEIVDEESKEGLENQDLGSEILLDPQVSASLVRAKLFESDEIPDFNQYENTLLNLYRTGDQIFQMLNSSALLYVKVRLQYYLVKELQFEVTLNPITQQKKLLDGPVKERLSDMLAPALKQLDANEDGSQDTLPPPVLPLYFVDDPSKNLLSQLSHSEFCLSDLRIRVRTLYVAINEQLRRYESIKEQFKRYQHMAKVQERAGQQQVGQSGQMQNSNVLMRSTELQVMFNYTKDKYLETMHLRIKSQLELYISYRSNLKNAPPGKAEKMMAQYRELRDNISVKKDSVPSILKDSFELFVDSHFKKSLLAQKRLIDENQKRLIRQVVLQCCAFCGPDSEFEANKITTKFLDLHKIVSDEEYETEGLIICIKWYMSILEERPAKRDLDTIKKLKGILDEMERQAKEARAAQLPSGDGQETGEQIDPNIAKQVFN